MNNTKIKILLLCYIIITNCVATLLLLGTLFTNQFVLACIVGLIFNLVIFLSCYSYYKYNDIKLLLLTQYIQIFGVGLYGLFVFMHANLFAGFLFMLEDSSLKFEVRGSLPEYAFTYIESADNLAVSLNLIPLIVIPLLKYTVNKKS